MKLGTLESRKIGRSMNRTQKNKEIAEQRNMEIQKHKNRNRKIETQKIREIGNE